MSPKDVTCNLASATVGMVFKRDVSILFMRELGAICNEKELVVIRTLGGVSNLDMIYNDRQCFLSPHLA